MGNINLVHLLKMLIVLLIIIIGMSIGFTLNKENQIDGFGEENKKSAKFVDMISPNGVISSSNKPYMWLYWETQNGQKKPNYVKLCNDTVKKNCSDSFEIVFLDENNVHAYLPEIKKYNIDLEGLIIAHKVDLYRIMLLYKYGGIYIDSDVIVLKDLKQIHDKLNDFDFVGFGCTGIKCTNRYGFPSNWVLVSKKKSILMKECLDILFKKFLRRREKSFGYHEIGKLVIWEALHKLIPKGYSYYHYDSSVDGSRDSFGNWVTSKMMFSTTPIKYDEENKLLFIVFYNSQMSENEKKIPIKELLHSKMNISKFFRIALRKN
jgi:hypothetical protein